MRRITFIDVLKDKLDFFLSFHIHVRFYHFHIYEHFFNNVYVCAYMHASLVQFGIFPCIFLILDSVIISRNFTY